MYDPHISMVLCNFVKSDRNQRHNNKVTVGTGIMAMLIPTTAACDLHA